MKKLMVSALALLVFMASAAQSLAQTMKPVVVVSVNSYDELMSDVDFLGQVTGIQMLSSQMAEEHLKQVTQGQGLQGLDRKKPLGGALMTDGGGDFRPLGFAPITNLKALTDSVAALGVQTKEGANGTTEITGPMGNSVFAKTQGNYTFFAQRPEQLVELPNPEAILENLNKDYDVAVRAHIQNIPAFFRQMIIGQLRAGIDLSLQRPSPGEDEAAFQMRKQLMQQNVKQLEQLVNDLDKFTVGASVDSAAKTVHLDFGFTVAPNSKLAKQIADQLGAKTEFAGFLNPEAAVQLNVVSKISPDDAKQSVAMLKQAQTQVINEIDKDAGFANEEIRKAAHEIIGDLVNVGIQTIESGKIDGGASVFLTPGAPSAVVGGYVADGAAVESVLKKVVELAKNEAQFPEVKFNSDKHRDITFHSMVVPVPDADAQRVLGESIDIVVGIAPKSVYVAFGKNAADSVKKVVDGASAAAAKADLPMQLIVSLGSIAKFVDSVEPNPMASMLADELAKTMGKDHVSLVVRPIENGAIYRLQAEEGVLKAIGQGFRLGMAGGAF